MRVHPGLSFLVTLVLAAVLEANIPASIAAPLFFRGVSSGFSFLTGAVLLFWAARTLQRQRTALEPFREPSAIVTSGPFRFSRNPMYLSNLLMMGGFVLLTCSAWFLVSVVVQFTLLSVWVVPAEEERLKRAFPELAANWFSKTRRWI